MQLDETLIAQQQVVRLQAPLEASHLIHSTIALDDVLHAVLQIVVRELELTGAFFELDPATHTMQVVNAGHNPAFLLSRTSPLSDELQLTKVAASGTPVGIIPFSSYKVETFPIPPGTRLLVYTDGLTEVFRGEEEFGETRLLDSFCACNSVHSEGVLESLWSTLDSFSDGQEQSDDMTALVLLRQPLPEARTEESI
jgi:serine phosphatase RsbU (regulator of sigma subunit)